MSPFLNKALAYVGLRDHEFYDDEYDEIEEPTLVSHTIYPEQVPENVFHQDVEDMERPLLTGDQRRSQAVVLPLFPDRRAIKEVHVVAPENFSEAQMIGDLLKTSKPVIVNLQHADRYLARRMIDFCSGLIYALSGSMEKVTEHVFVLSLSTVEVTPKVAVRH